MATFGGIVRFTYDGNPIVVRGHIKVDPSNVTGEPIINSDGSVSRSLKMTGFGMECSFEDSTQGTATPVSWDAILKGGPYNMTVDEEQPHVQHMFQAALFFGTPKVDRETGEVTGLTVKATTYTTTAL